MEGQEEGTENQDPSSHSGSLLPSDQESKALAAAPPLTEMKLEHQPMNQRLELEERKTRQEEEEAAETERGSLLKAPPKPVFSEFLPKNLQAAQGQQGEAAASAAAPPPLPPSSVLLHSTSTKHQPLLSKVLGSRPSAKPLSQQLGKGESLLSRKRTAPAEKGSISDKFGRLFRPKLNRLHRPSSLSSASNKAAAAAGPLTIKYGPKRLVPIDWNLKTEMRIVSTTPFSFLPSKSLSVQCEGLSSYFQHLPPYSSRQLIESRMAAAASRKQPPPSDLWVQASSYWCHPLDDLNNGIIRLKGQAATIGASVFFQKRVGTWEKALESLYFLFRNESCPYFYLVTRHHVILFTQSSSPSDDRNRTPGPVAYVSKSNRQLRKDLKAAFVKFSLPLVSQANSIPEEAFEQVHSHGAGAVPMEIEGQHRPSESPDRGPQHSRLEFQEGDKKAKPLSAADSLLIVQGPLHVHGLYEYLVNTHSQDLKHDVPTLLAPVPFMNAANKSVEWRTYETKTNETETRYILELEGHLLPHMVADVANLCTTKPPEAEDDVMALKKPSDRKSTEFVKIFMKTYTASARLNLAADLKAVLSQPESSSLHSKKSLSSSTPPRDPADRLRKGVIDGIGWTADKGFELHVTNVL